MAESENIKNEIYSKPINLSGLIDYQNGAVVSRTLINKTSGTVTLFAFDTGQGLSEHTAPYDASVYILEGEAEVFISGKSNLVPKGNIIIMPANEPHAVKAKKSFKMLLIMIKS